jgi:hypothetical protein
LRLQLLSGALFPSPSSPGKDYNSRFFQVLQRDIYQHPVKATIAPHILQSQYFDNMEWARQTYNKQYENWVPWAEDKYLAWFGENKTSYVAKGRSWLHQVRSSMPGHKLLSGNSPVWKITKLYLNLLASFQSQRCFTPSYLTYLFSSVC